MHELSLCRSIYAIAEKAASNSSISVVHLDVGQLRQVVPQTLEYCWGIVVENTPLADSVLKINHIPAVIKCDACSHDTRLHGIPMMVCEKCGSGNITVVSGEEFFLRSLDVRENSNGTIP